jgi:hypothetical protein
VTLRLRHRPRRRWCRRAVWSRMHVAFRSRRRCSAVVGSRLTIVVGLLWWCLKLTLPCDRCACATMGFLIG